MLPRQKFHALALVFCLALGHPAFGAADIVASKVDPRIWEDIQRDGRARFLIFLKDQGDAHSAAKAHVDRKAKRRSVTATLREAATRSQADVVRALGQQNITHRPYWIVSVIAADAGPHEIETLARRGDVQAIESDRAFHVPLENTSVASPQAIASVQPNLTRINATNLWALGFTGQGIVYANADTGVQWTHPALKPHYRGWSGNTANHNYNWWDAIHNDISGNGSNPVGFNSPSPVDDNGHGTHTMGIGIGDDGAGNQVGVAPGAKFICCRNMDEGVGRPSTYLECMQFFLAPTDLSGNNPDPDRGADTVGNSYTCPPSELCAPNTLHLMLQNLRAAGIFMAVSAGNDGPNCSTITSPPGLDAAAISIGATDNSDNIASFSSRGPIAVDGSMRRKPDLVAPGVSVTSSYPPSGYLALNGTSMSAPHVSGGVALLWSAFPHIRGNVDYTQSLLEQTALHLTSGQICGTNNGVPNNVFGYGRIDLLAAYNAVNRPPVASNQIVVVQGDLQTSITLSGSDPEAAPLSFQLVASATNGLLSNLNSTNGSLSYTPAHAFTGNDAVIFNVNDGTFNSSNATVQITVTAPADADHDGIPDYWEMSHSLNYTNAVDATVDSDNDGATNWQEYIANTSPQLSNSVLRITSISRDTNGHYALVWDAIGGSRYRLQFVDNPIGVSWNFVDVLRSVTNEMAPQAIGVAGTMTFVDDFSLTGTPPASGARYYRVRVVR